jgi:hypothetical protein
MRIDNIEIEYFINYIGRSIHILDKTRNHYQNLLNIMSPEFQKRIIEEEQLLSDVFDFDWICYGSGGLIMEFKEYTLVFVSKQDNRLHKPFIGVLGT